MHKRSNGHPGLGWLIFFILPIGSVIYALKYHKYKWSKNIVWAFVAFYGYIFTIPPNSQIDAVHRREYFEYLANHDISFQAIIRSLYTGNAISNTISYDVYNPLLSFLVAQFTVNYHIYFLCVGIIFGYFYSRNIWLILNNCDRRLKYGWVFVFLLLFIIPVWLIQSVRFYTAALVYIYGILLLYLNKNKYGIWISTLSILIHYSYILPVLLFIVYRLFIKDKYFKILFWCYIITLPLSFPSTDFVAQIASEIMPNIFQTKIDLYTSDRAIQKVEQAISDRSIFSRVYDHFRPVLMFILSVIIYINYKKVIKIRPHHFMQILPFIMLFLLVMNFIGNVPSIFRFFTVIFYLLIATFLLIYQCSVFSIRNWIVLIAPICLMYVVGITRYGAAYGGTGISYIIKSPLYLLIQVFV